MTTPVQLQYQSLKQENPDAILFFQLGDFFELFHEDARVGSRILGIQLTARHKGTDSEMPMCGFPMRAHKEYLETLTNQGYKVALAEQVKEEDGTISRRITRVVTPGTTIEEGSLDPEKNSYLVAIGYKKGQYGLSYTDVSTGEFRTANFGSELEFLVELHKLNPKEILIPTLLFEDESFCKKLPRSVFTPKKPINGKKSEEIITEKFGVQTLDGFGLKSMSLLVETSAMIFVYLKETQKTNLDQIQNIVRYHPEEFMALDRQTLRHLEVFEPIQYDDNATTLISIFEKSSTAMGGRRLRQFLLQPLLSSEKINERLAAVEEIVENSDLKMGMYKSLEEIPDMERVVSRIASGRSNGRDMAFLRDSLVQLPSLGSVVDTAESVVLSEQGRHLKGFDDLCGLLSKALVENPPIEISEGGIFRKGYNSELDRLRVLMEESDAWMEKFLKEKKEETGISTLRVKFSKNFGFTLEVTKSHVSKVPESWVRRQTLVNAERFSMPELQLYEENVLSAESKAYNLEHQLFVELRERVIDDIEKLQKATGALAMLDVFLVFARTAMMNRWCKPLVEQNRQDLVIEAGRHPVVEALSGHFVANNLTMKHNESRMQLITGPNMAGKSTFLRQNALIILLGQIGSYVPAGRVHMGIFDRIFTRVGASDNVSAGKSTFYTEMAETAHILRGATDKSFVILDEIGRGTSTFDGISLAWAITEHLHNEIEAKTLFATHYHELIDLADQLNAASNFHVSVAQGEHGIVFLRQIVEGGISDSFGIEVAKIAGVPESVVKKAQEVLQRLESDVLGNIDQPSLFGGARVKEILVEKESNTEKAISKMKVDDMSPKQALDVLFELKKNLGTKE